MMSDRPWWKTGVIYQIAVPSFADSNGDGWGDLRGIIDRLDYLQGSADALGIDAIWLSPINATPFADFGYDVSDYHAVDPRFGTMRDLEDLLAACHERGIRVMMDLVLNHTSVEHPWFSESRSSRDNPRRDWYVWRDGTAPHRPPNGWLAVVEGSAWKYDRATGQYYYHAFLPFQPDLNWRNPEVRHEMLDIARFWLEKGVDGFRLDLMNFLYEDEHLRDNPRRRFAIRPYLAQKHVHDASQPESLEAAKDLRRVADGFPGRALMGEVFTDRPEDCVAYLGDGTDRLHLSFYLDFIRRGWSAVAFRTSVQWLEDHLPECGWPCYYLDNHDLARSHTRLGVGGNAEARARVAAAMLLTLRGTPIIYYGQELGMPQSRVPRRLMRDPVGKRFWPLGVGRDGARTPMQWSGERHAGFSEAEPWLPADRSFVERNVEAESEDSASLLNWYRKLLRLRKERLSLREGSYSAIENTSGDVFAYIREHEGESTAVLLNFAARQAAVRLPEGVAEWHPLLSTHGERPGLTGPECLLASQEALILEAR
ncbi:MAG: alpha-glucosidase [Coriobacteriia bacterium]|nr:alpha-glucosidase [Coriobacteriia bacterium]